MQTDSGGGGIQKRLPRSPRDNKDWNLGENMRRGLAIPDFRDWGFPQAPLSQGDWGHCGGFGTAGKRVSAGSKQASIPQTDADGHAYYYAIKEIEGVKPNDPGYEDGIYTRDAFKFMKKQGWIQGYAFAENLSVAAQFLLAEDTLCFGSAWLSDMNACDKDGFINFGGNVVGGHFWEVRFYDSDKDIWGGQQSWGPFGKDGTGLFFLRGRDMQQLFSNAGEMGAAVETVGAPIQDNPGCGAVFAKYLRRAAADPEIKIHKRVARAALLMAKDLEKPK